MAAPAQLRGGTRCDGSLVPRSPALVGTGPERGVSRVRSVVPEGRLMRAMILGAGGMLGHDLVASPPGDIELFPFTRAALDITHAESLGAAVATVRPDVIVNAAGFTAVDRAESERELAFRVNGEAVGTLGRIAAHAAARV